MMSGLVCPKSVHLIDEGNIHELIKRSKLLFNFSKFMSISMDFAAIILSSAPIALNCSLYEFIFYVIPWSLLYTISSHYSTLFHVYQMTYFYLICYYLKFRLKTINSQIMNQINSLKRVNERTLENIIQSLNRLYIDIVQYNDTIWSKYLFWVLALFITLINASLYLVLFGEIGLILKVVMTYGLSFCILLLISLINIASSVAFEANKAYQLLNKLIIADRNLRIKISRKFQVFNEIFL